MFTLVDNAMFRLVNEYSRLPFLDKVLPYLSEPYVLLALLALFLLCFALYCKKYYGEFFWRLLILCITIILSWSLGEALTLFLQDTFQRLQPYQSLVGAFYFDTDTGLWKQVEAVATEGLKGTSMPANLAMSSMAVCFAIALLCSRTSPWIFIMPILVAWSCIYTGQNYPLDILVGWILAIFVIFVAWWLANTFFGFFTKNRKLS